jgi:phosphohistidine swiveling domain-containing protein
MPLLQPFRATNKTDASLAKWQVFRSRYIPAMLPILSYWSWPVKDIVGKDVGFVVNVWDKGYYQAIWEERGYRAVREYSLNFLLSHIKSSRDIRKQGIETGQKVVEVCKKFAAKANSAALNEFANFFKLLDKTYNEFTKRSMLLWLFSGEAVQAEIIKELSEMSSEEQHRIFSVMSIPDEKSYSQEEEEKFWKIVTLARKLGIDSLIVEKEIKKFSKEYFWFPYEYVGPTVWDVPTVRKRVVDALSSNEVEHTIKLQRRIDIKITKRAESFFAVLRAVSLMQDDRKMLNAQICFYLNCVILGALAKNLGIALENMRYLDPNLFDLFINASLDKTMVKKELKSRAGFCVVIQDAEKHEVYSGQAAKEKLKELSIQQEVHTADDVLHGQSAYKGKMIGRVKILHLSIEAQNFSEGDILVTGMTTPDFVPIIKKASAIITNEGGITSHAAILSRELKKPCIVGTKIATKILHDGDLVEVDADSGIVKIIKRNNLKK